MTDIPKFVSILNPAFDYTPASKTDLAKKFAAIRRRQKAEQKAAEQAATPSCVQPFRRLVK